MKKIYFLIFILIACVNAHAATITATAHTGVTINKPVLSTSYGSIKKWSVASTWVGGVVPNLIDDDIIIPANAIVILDQSVNLKSITVFGMLIVQFNKSLTIQAQNIMVMNGSINPNRGYFQWGVPSERYVGDGKLILKGVETNESVMGMGQKVLGAMDGAEIQLHGIEKTSWTQLNATANATTSNLVLRDAVNWVAGDTIIIASTDFDMNQAEKRVIASISNGKNITLSQSLNFRHFGEIQNYTHGTDATIKWELDESAEVGLLSRNIVIQGDQDSENSMFGGHVMVMGSAKSYISHVGFYRMGQRYRKGRYPFHWHGVMNAGGQYINNSTIYHTFNRAITVHATNNVDVKDNVAYDNIGHAYFMEDGTETGVTMTGNLGLVTRRPNVKSVSAPYFLLPSDIADSRNHSGPSTFWITNPNNRINNNHAAGSDGSGIWYAPFNNPNGLNYVASYQPLNMPIPGAGTPGYTMGAFDNNVMHSNKHGFILGAGPNAGDRTETPNENRGINIPANSKPTLKNILVFKNSLGAYTRTMPQNNQESYYENLIVADNRVGDAATWKTYYNKVLWVVGSANASTNYVVGDEVGGTTTAAHIVYDGPVVTTNSHFAGTTLANQSMFDQWGANLKYTGHTFTNTTVAPSAYRIRHRDATDNDNLNPVWFLASVRDLDGKLSGTPNVSIVKNNPYLLPVSTTPLPLIGANGVKSPLLFGYIEATGSDHLSPQEIAAAPIGTIQRYKASILRSDGPQYSDRRAIQGYPITTILNQNISHRLVLKEQVPARMRFDVYSQSQNQDIVLEYPNVSNFIKVYNGDAVNENDGRNLVLIPPSPVSSVNDLLAISATGTQWFWKDGTAYIRYKAPIGSNFESDQKLESIFVCLYGNCVDGNNSPVVIADFNARDTRGSVVKASGTSTPDYTSAFNGVNTYTVNSSDLVAGAVNYTLTFPFQNWEEVSNISVQFNNSPAGVLFIKYSDDSMVPLVVSTGGNVYLSSVGQGSVYRKFNIPVNVKNKEVIGLVFRTRLADLVGNDVVRIGEIRLGIPPSEGGLATVVNPDVVTSNGPLTLQSDIKNDFLVYPNPSNGIFNLKKEASWKILNLNGQIIKNGKGVVIDLKTYPKGSYFIRLNEKVTQKIILE